jgi:quercetin dioxygenase-like cupin family protein
VNIRKAEVVLPCADVQETVAFFTTRLGFRLDAIHPADDPRVAVVSGHGVTLRFDRAATCAPGVLRLSCRERVEGERELVAPNGTRIELVPPADAAVLPPLRPSFVWNRSADAQWVEGRAGMRYRDLVPDRQGGRYIASHIQIPSGGPVADYVHFHEVHFQLIYCVRGWVRLVYEDQGPPFVLAPGDCVLQPPRIRHRVLESSPGLEVIEVAAPAAHETFADHDLALPTKHLNAWRNFGGQRFHRHHAASAAWRPRPPFVTRDLGIGEASGGVVAAEVVRRESAGDCAPASHDAELFFAFVLRGAATLKGEGRVAEGDAFVIPARNEYALLDCTADLELLEIRA